MGQKPTTWAGVEHRIVALCALCKGFGRPKNKIDHLAAAEFTMLRWFLN